MFNKRKQVLLERTELEQQLHYQQIAVVMRKDELLTAIHHQYSLLLIGALTLAFMLGWKIGKDIGIVHLSKQLLRSGLMLLASQYQLMNQ